MTSRDGLLVYFVSSDDHSNSDTLNLSYRLKQIHRPNDIRLVGKNRIGERATDKGLSRKMEHDFRLVSRYRTAEVLAVTNVTDE